VQSIENGDMSDFFTFWMGTFAQARAYAKRREVFMKEKHVSVVFVVDDEVIISKSLAMILQHSGYSARFFTNPLEALEHIKADPPDLVISDVVMPQLSGVDLAIQVKAHCSDCEILLFSGQASTIDLLGEARKQGHTFTLLSKPVHPTDLLREIDRLQGARSDAIMK
jgi:DNA-binding NtrC family response regulator